MPQFTFPTQDTVGEYNSTTVFNADGSVTETDLDSGVVTTTVFNADGTITETFGSKTKTTTFNPDGSISEAIS